MSLNPLPCKLCKTSKNVEVFDHGGTNGPYQVVHHDCGCWGPCNDNPDKSVEGWNYIMKTNNNEE